MRWLAGILVGIVLLEVALRWVGFGEPPLARLDPVTEYELIGPAEYSRWGNRVAINSLGLRAEELADGPRLLLIGDSVVYGGHFLDQSETIAARMQAALATGACTPQVLPMAVSSWGPVNQAAFLQKTGTLGANAAGIVISAHDLYDLPRHGADIVPYRLDRPIGAIGDLVEAVWERILPEDDNLPTAPAEIRATQSLDGLREIVTRLRADAIAPTLIYHPTASERSGDPRPARDIFADWARDNGLAFVDLGHAIAANDGYRDNIHPDATGAARIATALQPLFSDHLRCS